MKNKNIIASLLFVVAALGSLSVIINARTGANSGDRLPLDEAFVLISIDDQDGLFVHQGPQTHIGLAGAILAELEERGKIDILDKRVILKNAAATGLQELDDVLFLMEKKGKNKKVKYWIKKLARKGNGFKWAVLKRLIAKGILKKEKSKKLLRKYKYTTCDNTLETGLKAQLKNILLGEQTPDSNSTHLIGLIGACKLKKNLSLTKDELETIKTKIKLMVAENVISRSVKKVLKDVEVLELLNQEALVNNID